MFMTTRATRFGGWPRALVLVLLLVGRDARADNDPPPQAHAAQVFAEAERAFKAADYERAAKLFEEAHELRPHPASLANAAKARRLMGDLATSANHYQELASEARTPDDVKEAKAALASLAPMLGRLTIVEARADHRVLLDGSAIARTRLGVDHSIYVTPGAHRIESIDAEGRATKRTVRVADGERATIELEDAPESSPTRVELRAPPPATTTSTDQGPFQVSPLVTLIAAGVVLASAGVTTWSGIDTLDERSAWDARPSNATLDAGLDKQRRTNILLGVTLSAAAVTSVLALFFTRWHGDSRAQ